MNEIKKIVFSKAKKLNVDEAILKKQLIDEINKASKEKKEESINIRKAYNKFIESHNSRFKKANMLCR